MVGVRIFYCNDSSSNPADVSLQFLCAKYCLKRSKIKEKRLRLANTVNNHQRGKYHCMSFLLFDWFGLDQTRKTVTHSM